MKTPKWLQVVIATTSTLCLMSVLAGCAHVLILPADRVVVPMKAGKAYAPPFDGYYVPAARMQDILDRLSEGDVFGTNNLK